MGELMRLSIAAAALVAGTGCVLLAAHSLNRSEPAADARAVSRAFAGAAVLLAICLPFEALDAAGRLSPLAAAGVLGLLAGALTLTLAGRTRARRTARTATRRRPTAGLRRAKLMLSTDMVAVVSPEFRGQVAAAAQHVRPVSPSVFVAVADGDYGVELNQN
jgi:hypothetical protein